MGKQIGLFCSQGAPVAGGSRDTMGHLVLGRPGEVSFANCARWLKNAMFLIDKPGNGMYNIPGMDRRLS